MTAATQASAVNPPTNPPLVVAGFGDETADLAEKIMSHPDAAALSRWVDKRLERSIGKDSRQLHAQIRAGGFGQPVVHSPGDTRQKN